MHPSDHKLLARVAVLALLLVGLVVFWQTGLLAEWLGSVNRDQVAVWVEQAGWWGPLLIVGLITLAIVASPIPSAPIGLAAGAAYGVGTGTLLITLGAELGALIAFGLARWLGYRPIRRWLGPRVDQGLLGSQNHLMVTVFVSRLLPFVSFDLISYAAGLSALSFWRFAIATLAGILPASAVIAWFGAEAMSGDPVRATLATLGLGALTGGTALLAWWRMRRA